MELLPSKIVGRLASADVLAQSRPQIPIGGMDLREYLFKLEKGCYEEAMARSEANAEKAAELLGLQGPAFRKAWRERFGRGE